MPSQSLNMHAQLPSGAFVHVIWFFTSQSTIFQLCRDGSSWVEPVLRINVSCSRTQRSDAGEAWTDNPSVSTTEPLWCWWGLNPQPLDSSQALYHWAPYLSGAGLNFGLRLHVLPYFVYASSKGSGKIVHMCRLVWAFSAHQCDVIESMYLLNMPLGASNVDGSPK